MSSRGGILAVAIHDVEARSGDRCVEICEWLLDRGVDRATLLVIPAPGGRPLDPAGELAGWLRQRRSRGDAVAQHGLHHAHAGLAPRPRRWIASMQGGAAAEFAALDGPATARALERGRGILREAGLDPRGFVAPAYCYTGHLRRELAASYAWWTDLVAVRRRGGSRYSPVLCLGASTALKRATSPPLVRGLARLGRPLMRIDVHPADLEHRRARRALEDALHRARERDPVTYDQLP
jgi:predicted deacetylase